MRHVSAAAKAIGYEQVIDLDSNACQQAKPRRLRIAHVTATFPPYKGGTGNVCYHNTAQLARLGHEVHVFTAAVPDAPGHENMSGVAVHRLRPLVRVGNAPLLPGLLTALRGFDLVHLHFPFIGGAEMVRVASLLYGIPFVVSFHNDLIGEGGRARLFAAYQEASALVTVRWAALLCAVSADHYEHSILRRSLRSSKPPYVELPNGVDVDAFRPPEPELNSRVREQHGVPHDAPLALFVAALDRAHHFKGLDRLLDAFAAVTDLAPGAGTGSNAARLLVIGDGDLRARYQARANELGVGERVIFVGALPQVETAPYFGAADVTVLPSSPPESFGLVLIESMACGTPVIASDIPGVRVVVRNGADGFLVEHANVAALASVLASVLAMSAAERSTMGAAGMRKVLQRYAWPRIGRQLEDIYFGVLRSRRSTRPVVDSRRGRAGQCA